MQLELDFSNLLASNIKEVLDDYNAVKKNINEVNKLEEIDLSGVLYEKEGVFDFEYGTIMGTVVQKKDSLTLEDSINLIKKDGSYLKKVVDIDKLVKKYKEV